ncbi:MAB_1171c family putative transporter [Nocardia sp. GCM10030253]|uniref:MAB_1171c family putative transporter n=1 Tax=Nocardia sp. GCM10030253 TaxID=3273404 RepID=UPI00363AB9E0
MNWLAAVVDGYAWLIFGIRTLWFRSTLVDRRLNRIVCLSAVATTLRLATVQQWLTTWSDGILASALLYQLATIAGLFNMVTAMLLAQAVHNTSARPRLVYAITTACAIALIICGTSARRMGIPVHDQVGLAPLAFWLFVLPAPIWSTVTVLRLGIAELRTPLRRRESALYLMFGALLFILVADAVWLTVSAAFQVHSSSDWRQTRAVHNSARTNDTILLLLLCIIATIPALSRLVELLSLDSWSRRRKRLLPMWSDLTAACPEIVHHAPAPAVARRSRYLVHRTVIEVRDSVRALTHYATPNPPKLETDIADAAPPGPERDALDLAVRLARACTAKERGAPTSVVGALRLPPARDLFDEVDQLAAIAAHWPHARALADQVSEYPQQTRVE